jgi:hypothetical protein
VRALSSLGRIPSAVAKSPWFWPVVPLVAVAGIGQWVSITVAQLVAAACGVFGIGILIGLTLAGGKADASQSSENVQGASSAQVPPTEDGGGSAQEDPGITDLRGARLVNAKLECANLRLADLRGAILTGADLSGADLTGARLGPLDDDGGAD